LDLRAINFLGPESGAIFVHQFESTQMTDQQLVTVEQQLPLLAEEEKDSVEEQVHETLEEGKESDDPLLPVTNDNNKEKELEEVEQTRECESKEERCAEKLGICCREQMLARVDQVKVYEVLEIGVDADDSSSLLWNSSDFKVLAQILNGSALVRIVVSNLKLEIEPEEDSSMLCVLMKFLKSLDCSLLKTIKISACGIKSIEGCDFSEFSRLEILDLSNNELEELPEKLKLPSTIKSVSFKNNFIKNVANPFEHHVLCSIKEFDFRENLNISFDSSFIETSRHYKFQVLTSDSSFQKIIYVPKRKSAIGSHRISPDNEISSSDRPAKLLHSSGRRPHESLTDERYRKKSREAMQLSLESSTLFFQSCYIDYEEIIPDGFMDHEKNNLNDFSDLKEDFNKVLVYDRNLDVYLQELLDDARDLLSDVDLDCIKIKLLALFVSNALGGKKGFRENENDAPDHDNAKVYSGAIHIGRVSTGLAKHRAVLFKYIADRLHPRLPSALIRGFKGASFHTWNLVKVSEKDFILDCLYSPNRLKQCFSLSCGPVLNWNDVYFPQFQSFLEDDVNFSRHILTSQIGPPIGKGANSTVFTCYFPRSETLSLGKLCAVKITDLKGFNDESILRIYKEIFYLSEIKHHNVVKCLGYQIVSERNEKSQLRVFLEFIHGFSLRTLIEKSKSVLPISDTLALAYNICEGIKYLHSKDLIHRDLKSDNIMIEATLALGYTPCTSILSKLDSKFVDRTSKICDLSNLALISSGKEEEKMEIFGSLFWLAPEIVKELDPQFPIVDCERFASYSKKTDIYAFGIILYEMLSGKLPFEDVSQDQIYEVITQGTATQEAFEKLYTSSECSTRKQLIRLAQKCVDVSISNRPDSTQISNQLTDIIRKFFTLSTQ
jgi:tRNA A-37 threonylcarbamoyl transferase component Bud32